MFLIISQALIITPRSRMAQTEDVEQNGRYRPPALMSIRLISAGA